MNQKIIDISPRISAKLAVWPGDVPVTREVAFDMKRGDVVTLSALRATVHLGAHADAPSHYSLDGRTMEQQPLELYWGKCEVIKVNPRATTGSTSNQPGLEDRFGRDDLAVSDAWVPTLPRVLFATGTYPNNNKWSADFIGMQPSLVDWLADHGVKLVGVDTPSVDCAESKELPSHKRFFARDMAILEGLVLSNVQPGRYELCALPLALEGFDGSPVRAALRTIE